MEAPRGLLLLLLQEAQAHPVSPASQRLRQCPLQRGATDCGRHPSCSVCTMQGSSAHVQSTQAARSDHSQLTCEGQAGRAELGAEGAQKLASKRSQLKPLQARDDARQRDWLLARSCRVALRSAAYPAHVHTGSERRAVCLHV